MICHYMFLHLLGSVLSCCELANRADQIGIHLRIMDAVVCPKHTHLPVSLPHAGWDDTHKGASSSDTLLQSQNVDVNRQLLNVGHTHRNVKRFILF